MTFSFNINKITPTSLDIPTFSFEVETITPSVDPEPTQPPIPTTNLILKDKDGKILYDSNNKRLLVRG